jgi:ABC-type Fe3+/spermidine/putrescine transport system ATPase subunit
VNYLEIQDLRLSRGDFDLEISLALDRGETGVILGPSGCGKTSLLRCIAGLEHPQSGEICVNGIDIGGLAPEKRKLGFVFQDLALFDHLDGRGNLEFGLRLAGEDKERRRAISSALADTLRISTLLDRKPGTMSGGEKQRLAFARALATKPEILLLDEPLSSLDAPLRKELRRYLRTMLRQEGITALHVTHDVEEAVDLGDRIFLLNRGRLVAEGSPSEVFKNPPDAWCVNFLGLGPTLPVRKSPHRRQPLMYETPYGTFSIPGRISASESDWNSNNVFYFIPSEAIYSTDKSFCENPGTKTNPDMLFGIIEKVSEKNGIYHTRLRLRPKEDSAPPSLEPGFGGEELYIEFDSMECPDMKEGEAGCFRIRTESCSILPGSAKKSL